MPLVCASSWRTVVVFQAGSWAMPMSSHGTWSNSPIRPCSTSRAIDRAVTSLLTLAITNGVSASIGAPLARVPLANDQSGLPSRHTLIDTPRLPSTRPDAANPSASYDTGGSGSSVVVVVVLVVVTS